MLVIKAGIHKMHVRIANREDADQTAYLKQSDLGLCCLSRPLGQEMSVQNKISVQNFRTLTVPDFLRNGKKSELW